MFTNLPFDDERKDMSLRSPSKKVRKDATKRWKETLKKIDLDILVPPASDSVIKIPEIEIQSRKRNLSFPPLVALTGCKETT